MPIWRTIPVDEQPEIILTEWRIVEMPDRAIHFNGWCEANREGRMSSQIVTFDTDTRKGRTRSGRVYQLVGRPGVNTHADYVLNRWLAANSIERAAIRFIEPPSDA